MRFETLSVRMMRRAYAAGDALLSPDNQLIARCCINQAASSSDCIPSAERGNARAALAERLSALEGGVATALFASGSAAMAGIFQALRPGDHVLAPAACYHGTPLLLEELFSRWGLEATHVEMTDPARVERAIRPNTRLVWVETPSNPLLKVTDIARIAAIAHDAGAICICDNTWATPVLQRPLRLGADFVVHSTAKYLGGHTDTLGGAVVARQRDAFFERVERIQRLQDAAPSPMECELILRGIRTLPHRMRAHSENALTIARYLDGHPAVERVYYPGLETHPNRVLAARQMADFGGMLVAQLKGGREKAAAVAAGVRLFTHATSLGGTESLIELCHPIDELAGCGGDSCLRLSTGLEHPDDLIADLAQALA